MRTKILFFSVFSIFLAIPSTFATSDNMPTLDYIHTTGEEGTYIIYGKDIGLESWLNHIYIDDQKVETNNMIFEKDSIKLKNFYPNAGAVIMERMKIEYDTGGTTATYVTEWKTDSITIRKNNTIGFNEQIIRENKGIYTIITLPFIKPLASSDALLGLNSMKSKRKIFINGQEKLLVEFAGEYIKDTYYFTTQGVTFLEENLTELVNTIGLEIDGLTSNYINIKKEGIILENFSQIKVENIGTRRDLKIFFPVPKNFSNLTNKEIYINKTKIDNNQVTIGLGQLIIRYDIATLPADQDTLSISLKDTISNTYSNEQTVYIGNYSIPRITSIDTGNGDSGHFTFGIKGNDAVFFGDIFNFKININGTEYTRTGIQQAVTDKDGVIQKDDEGIDRYETKQQISFSKTGEGIEFDFFSSLLKDGENILFVKNENTGRESNKVSFIKESKTPANYSYLTGTTFDESLKKEVMTFEVGKDFEKKLNPTNIIATDLDISLGKLHFSNLKNNYYYSVDFTIVTDLLYNPFAKMTLGGMNLETEKNGDKLSFVFKKQGLGKDFTTDMELISTINELYNASDKASSLNISEIHLEKLMQDNIYKTIVTLANPLESHIFYAYTNNTCFDGVKDFCSLIGETDPLLTIEFSASGAPIIIEAPVQVVPPSNIVSTTGTTTKIVRRNISTVVLYDFENKKFKKVQDILVQKYEVLKKRGSAFATTFRNATNNLLLALKNYEMNIDRTTSITQVGSSLKTLNEALRKAKKE